MTIHRRVFASSTKPWRYFAENGAKKCTKIYNARAEQLNFQLKPTVLWRSRCRRHRGFVRIASLNSRGPARGSLAERSCVILLWNGMSMTPIWKSHLYVPTYPLHVQCVETSSSSALNIHVNHRRKSSFFLFILVPCLFQRMQDHSSTKLKHHAFVFQM